VTSSIGGANRTRIAPFPVIRLWSRKGTPRRWRSLEPRPRRLTAAMVVIGGQANGQSLRNL
jgi:hypothetical protein